MTTISEIEKDLVAKPHDVMPTIGDTVRVHVRITEADKTRVQVFEGTVIRIRNGGPRTSFTVRKISFSVGVERVFPLYSPWLDKIEIMSKHYARRSKLYYLRDRKGKKARLRELRY